MRGSGNRRTGTATPARSGARGMRARRGRSTSGRSMARVTPARCGSDRAVGGPVYLRTRTLALLVFVAAIVIAVAAIGLTVFRPGGEGPVLRSTPSVITEIRDLSRL